MIPSIRPLNNLEISDVNYTPEADYTRTAVYQAGRKY